MKAIIRGFKNGKSYSEILDADNEIEIEVGDTLLGPSMVGKLVESIGAIPFLVIFFALAMGGVFGDFAAERKRDYLVLLIDGENYAVVQGYQDGLLLAAYEIDMALPNRVTLTGQTMYIELSETSKMPFQQLDSVFLEKNMETEQRDERVSFSEFVEQLKNLF